jgi:hypothetical protein
VRLGRGVPALSAVIVLGTVVVGSGCNGCDDIGCIDQVVNIDAGELPTSLLPFDITACVDGSCHEIPYTVTEQDSPTVGVILEVPTTGVERGDVVSVTLAVSSHATGEVLLETSGSATAVRSRPGNACESCTQASLKLDPGSGALIEPPTSD